MGNKALRGDETSTESADTEIETAEDDLTSDELRSLRKRRTLDLIKSLADKADQMGKEVVEAPPPTDDEGKEKVERIKAVAEQFAEMVKGLEVLPRTTRTWVDDHIRDLRQVLEFDLVDGLVQPKNPELNEWIKPFNAFVLAERALGDTDDVTPLQTQLIQTLLVMADGDWLAACGLPKNVGLQVHIADSPVRKGKGIVPETMGKFRTMFYGPIDHKKVSKENQRRFFDNFYYAASSGIGPVEYVKVGKHIEWLGSRDGCRIIKRGQWLNAKKKKSVSIVHVLTPAWPKSCHNGWGSTADKGRIFVVPWVDKHLPLHRKIEIFVNTHVASQQYTIEQEMRAMEKLKGMVTQAQYNSYMITGVFREDSPKSKVAYFLRKLRPTVAFKIREADDGGETLMFLVGLCLHPMAYYLDSFAGCLCPTDDVLVHLLWIRGDEHKFWSKANHHPLHQSEIGLP